MSFAKKLPTLKRVRDEEEIQEVSEPSDKTALLKEIQEKEYTTDEFIQVLKRLNSGKEY